MVGLGFEDAGDAKVKEHYTRRVTFALIEVDHDIGGRDVAMDDGALESGMRLLNCVAKLGKHPLREVEALLLSRQRLHACGKRFAWRGLHDHDELVAYEAAVKDVGNVIEASTCLLFVKQQLVHLAQAALTVDVLADEGTRFLCTVGTQPIDPLGALDLSLLNEGIDAISCIVLEALEHLRQRVYAGS